MATLFEHGTLTNLMAGNLAGTITIDQLLKHGSQGIGTFSDLDGEIIILHNQVYQAISTGKVKRITSREEKLPFAVVNFPGNGREVEIEGANVALLNNELVKDNELQNVFAALWLSGEFKQMHVRIAAKQQAGTSLLQAAHKQAEFKREKVRGTLIGYYAPKVFNRITAGGWHLHFLSSDHKFGGHVLYFSAPELKGKLEIFDTLEQHFPIQDQAFRQSKANLQNLQAGIAASEGTNK